MPPRYRVFNVAPETERRLAQISEQLGLALEDATSNSSEVPR
jgi:hypothetical protein